MSVDILETSCDQCRSMVQYIFTSAETRRLVRTDSPGRQLRLSHSSWTMIPNARTVAFYCAFLNSGVLTALVGCYMAGATWNRCRLGARFVYTVQPRTSLQSHFIRSHVRSWHVCLTVTCHPNLSQNGLDLLRATAVVQGGTVTEIRLRVSAERWPWRGLK